MCHGCRRGAAHGRVLGATTQQYGRQQSTGEEKQQGRARWGEVAHELLLADRAASRLGSASLDHRAEGKANASASPCGNGAL